MVSLAPGTPMGLQLLGVNQSLETEPVQEEVPAEEHKRLSQRDRQTRGSQIAGPIRRLNRNDCQCRLVDILRDC